MGFADKWYPGVLSAMRSIRGDGPLSTAGDRLPVTRPLDTLAILAQCSGPLASSIRGFQERQNGAVVAGTCLASEHLSNGVFRGDMIMLGAQLHAGIARGITIKDYLAGVGTVGSEWQRRASNVAGPTYEIWIADTFRSEPHLLGQFRSAIKQWQLAINVSASLISAYGSNLMGAMDESSTQGFWTAIRRLCQALDLIAANPPATTYDRIRGATVHAIDESAKFVGEGAAAIAEGAGRTAGNLLGGFLDGAGFYTVLIVAGVAVYLLV
jgi:hypothetical protein